MQRLRLVAIRERVKSGDYDLTAHAGEEMAEDDLDILDVESAILTGKVVRIEKDDARGNKYVIEGVAADAATPVGVVGRITANNRFLVVTVYQIDF